MTRFSRRSAIMGALGSTAMLVGGTAFLTARPGRSAEPVSFTRYPFALGVASGDPTAAGFVLWTRLCHDPFDPDDMRGRTVEVNWRVARDENFRQVVASGTALAAPERSHCVHVELYSLEPGRDYWYQFEAGGVESPAGRAVTLPTPGSAVDRLKMAWASCQHFEQGYFTAYDDMRAWDPRLIFHVGDYIYESSWGRQLRRHPGPEPVSLDDYRRHHAAYKLDPSLQAAHAHTSWAFTWDDHEVENDYAGLIAQNPNAAQDFVARRAAAYQAYREHLPLSRRTLPGREGMRLYQQIDYGNLASFFFLDTRQWRSPRPCVDPENWRSHVVRCDEIFDPSRSMLGATQEAWLGSSFRKQSHWTCLVQTTLFSHFDQKTDQGEKGAFQDGWGAYPASRKWLTDLAVARQIDDLVVIGGDMHGNFAADVKADFDNPGSRIIGTEFVGTSITSQSFNYDRFMQIIREGDNGHIRYFDDRQRGYARADIAPNGWQVDFRAIDSTVSTNPQFTTQQQFAVERGQPGVQIA